MKMTTSIQTRPSRAAQNTCKLCAPLGASMVFKGIRGAMSLLHGSQGCSTYIRRYIIGHFREPMDIASSSFVETTAIFGGRENLFRSLDNICTQYRPGLIGIATTCLSETIGDDVSFYIREYRNQNPGSPPLVHVSTPSYRGTHADGFHDAVAAVVAQLAAPSGRHDGVNIFPGFLSPADIRHFKEIVSDFGLNGTVLPDYSETLDAGPWEHYQVIADGGTPLESIRSATGAAATIELGSSLVNRVSAGAYLLSTSGTPLHRSALPVGVKETDSFFSILAALSRRAVPRKYQAQRQRLLDSYIDGHKFVFGKRTVIFGEEDLVCSTCSFAHEIGLAPVLCATGGKSGAFRKTLYESIPGLPDEMETLEGADFATIEKKTAGLSPDIIIGSSKGYGLSRSLNVPLVRVGFPVHDRIGAQRILHVGYEGTQMLFDHIVNALIEHSQNGSPIGYATW